MEVEDPRAVAPTDAHEHVYRQFQEDRSILREVMLPYPLGSSAFTTTFGRLENLLFFSFFFQKIQNPFAS